MTQNPDPQLDEIDAAGPAEQPPAPSTPPAKADAGSGVYAVYDKELLRYTGGTHATRKAADKVKSDRAGKGDRGRYEVREV